MKTIYIQKSNVQIVYPREPHVKSLASLVLLNNYYKNLQDEPYRNITNYDKVQIPSWQKDNWKLRVGFNTNFLRKKLLQENVLTCVYCGKTNLIIDCLSKGNLATADHFLPVVKGGEPFDERNLVVCCYRCNTNKSDKKGYYNENNKATF